MAANLQLGQSSVLPDWLVVPPLDFPIGRLANKQADLQA
jgi:hypothetical protein